MHHGFYRVHILNKVSKKQRSLFKRFFAFTIFKLYNTSITSIILNRQLENIYAQRNKRKRISLLPNKYFKCRNVKKKTSNDHYGCEMYSNDKKAIIAVIVTLYLCAGYRKFILSKMCGFWVMRLFTFFSCVYAFV